jgi:hypothetical protein
MCPHRTPVRHLTMDRRTIERITLHQHTFGYHGDVVVCGFRSMYTLISESLTLASFQTIDRSVRIDKLGPFISILSSTRTGEDPPRRFDHRSSPRMPGHRACTRLRPRQRVQPGIPCALRYRLSWRVCRGRPAVSPCVCSSTPRRT